MNTVTDIQNDLVANNDGTPTSGDSELALQHRDAIKHREEHIQWVLREMEGLPEKISQLRQEIEEKERQRKGVMRLKQRLTKLTDRCENELPADLARTRRYLHYLQSIHTPTRENTKERLLQGIQQMREGYHQLLGAFQMFDIDFHSKALYDEITTLVSHYDDSNFADSFIPQTLDAIEALMRDFQ